MMTPWEILIGRFWSESEDKAQMNGTVDCIKCGISAVNDGINATTDNKGRGWCVPCVKTYLGLYIKPLCSVLGTKFTIGGASPVCALPEGHKGSHESDIRTNGGGTLKVKWED
jgi:hypothetical protein